VMVEAMLRATHELKETADPTPSAAFGVSGFSAPLWI
jgi:hypothetical protein